MRQAQWAQTLKLWVGRNRFNDLLPGLLLSVPELFRPLLMGATTEKQLAAGSFIYEGISTSSHTQNEKDKWVFGLLLKMSVNIPTSHTGVS